MCSASQPLVKRSMVGARPGTLDLGRGSEELLSRRPPDDGHFLLGEYGLEQCSAGALASSSSHLTRKACPLHVVTGNDRVKECEGARGGVPASDGMHDTGWLMDRHRRGTHSADVGEHLGHQAGAERHNFGMTLARLCSGKDVS